ncbi:MAG: twin-arginine translocase subunit TatC [Planctomycetes bacterium]|nr:twin-arginine translocase subunit TatC [Planctomycetota bacterium]
MTTPVDDEVPFSSHLDELRRRLIWVVAFFFVAFSAAFGWGADPVVRYIQELAFITNPITGQAVRIKLSVISPMETFSTTMNVSLYLALTATYPFAMFQVWRFIAPGLYRNERRFALFLIPAIFVLFFTGAAFGRYVLLPFSIPFLLGFNIANFNVEPAYTLQAFLSLVFAMTFGLGLIFQVPLIVAPLIRFNVVAPDFFAKKRKYTIVISIIIGALVSPTGNPADMFVAAAPVFLLVEGGVALGRLWRYRALKAAQRKAEAAQARGEPVDLENLAGGLAIDLEKKLKELSSGGARKLAREFFSGIREAKQAWAEEAGEPAKKATPEDMRSLFDDDYKDSDRSPSPVRLKKPPPKGKKALAAGQVSETTVPLAPAPLATAPVAPAKIEEHPDRPWVEGVNEELARYIDDRIACRLDELTDRRVRPMLQQALLEWGEKFKQELRENGKGNGHAG